MAVTSPLLWLPWCNIWHLSIRQRSQHDISCNARRAALMRSNFLRHWQAAKRDGKTPKVIAKFGSNHIVRGLNNTATFDLGTLLPEIAAAEGSRSFSVLELSTATTCCW